MIIYKLLENVYGFDTEGHAPSHIHNEEWLEFPDARPTNDSSIEFKMIGKQWTF